MNFRPTILAAALALAAALPASAEEFRPIQAQPIALADASGIAYYTVEPGGFRVVATLGQGEDATPLRVEALLTPGQRLVLSAPRGAGTPPEAVEIGREGDRVFLRKAAAAVTN